MKHKGKQAVILLLLFVLIAIFYSTAWGDNPNTLSLSCKGADIVDVLRGIAIQNGVNIVPDGSVSGTVTIHLDNAPFEAGLRTLLETNGFIYEKQDSIYLVRKKVTTPETLQIAVSDDTLTVDARGADVKEVIRQLSIKAGINIVAESTLTGNITAHFSNVPIDDALRVLFSANNYTLQQDAGVYRIGSKTSRQNPSFAIFSNKGLLTIEVQNAQPVEVLSEIALQSKINLVTVGNIQGNLTMRLEDVTLEQALDLLTAASGSAYKKVDFDKLNPADSIYVVGDPTAKPGQENPLLEKKVIWLKYIEASDFISALPADIPRQSVTASQDRNAIIVLGTKQTIEEVEQLVEELDIENADIRSRQQYAIFVDVDALGLISIDVKDAPMELVIRELSVKTGIDVTLMDTTGVSAAPSAPRRTRAVPARGQTQTAPQQPTGQAVSALSSRGYSGIVNVRMEKATLEQILDALFSGTEYTYKIQQSGDKEFYIVGTGELLLGGTNPLTISKKIPLAYLDATKIIDLLPPTIPDANITLIPEQNAIAVVGTSQMIAFLEEYLKQIDSPTPQVMIEAMLIELTSGSTSDFGIEWSASKDRSILQVADGLGFVFDSLEKVPEAFDASLKALLAENKARILSAPRVAVLSGEKAVIDIGVQYLFQTTTSIYGGGYVIPTQQQPTTGSEQQFPYQPSSYQQRSFNTINTGITLDITPWVGNAGEITMMIAPQIRDADRVTAEESRIADRSIDTVIRIPDGGMIIIGGLIQEKELTQKDKVPVLGSIPLMGRLFSSSHKVANQSELIIVIKPKLIRSMTEGKTDER
jgi:type IV pilus assembly protein PilQ